MSSLEAVCASLAEGEGVLEALQDLNALLERNPSAAFASEVASSLPLSRLFHLIPYGLAGGDRDREAPQLIGRTCAVLDKVLAVLPAPEVATYAKYIELGLQISVENVKKTSLGVLKKHSSDPSVHTVLCAPTMFHLVTQIIGDDSLQCAKMSSDLLLQFLTTPTSLVPGLRESLMIDLQALMRKSDIVRYRVYELCVEAVLKGGREAFDFVSSSGFLNQLVDELSGDDILVKLNCIELLSQLLDSDEGAAFLERNEVLDKLHSLLVSVRQDPLGDVVIPGLLKFFGTVSLSKRADSAAVCERYPEFLRLILEALPTPANTTLWGTAVDTFGVLGSTESGRRTLQNMEAELRASLDCLGDFIVNGHSDVRTRTLRSVSMLLSCPEEGRGRKWEESTSLQWFNTLHPKLLTVLMSIAKQPFQDLRLAGLRLLLTMSSFEWGQRQFQEHAGFLEYLLDRSTEHDKEGRELKYEIVHSLVGSGSIAETVFGNVDLLKLRKYDREGPFYSSADTTIALEGM